MLASKATKQHKGSDIMRATCRYYVPNLFKAKKGKGYCCYEKLKNLARPCIYDIWSAHPQITPTDENESAKEVAEAHCIQPGFCRHYTPQ